MFGASRSVVSSMPARKRSGKSARTWKSSLRSVCLIRSAIFPLFRSEAACARNLSTRSRSSALNCPRSMAIPCRRASFASSDGDVGPPGPPGGGRGDGEGDGDGAGVIAGTPQAFCRRFAGVSQAFRRRLYQPTGRKSLSSGPLEELQERHRGWIFSIPSDPPW